MVRVGDTHFKCRGRTECKAFSLPQANDGAKKAGSSNAFAHLVSCCPEKLPQQLLFEPFDQLRRSMDKKLAEWSTRLSSASGAACSAS